MALKRKIITPVKANQNLSAEYTRELLKLARMMTEAIKAEVISALEAHEDDYVADSIPSTFASIFERLNKKFTGVVSGGFAEKTAMQAIIKLAKKNKEMFSNNVERMTGVNPNNIIQSEGLEDFIKINIQKNTALIKTLPQQYISQVQTIVSNGVSTGVRASVIAKQINGAVGSANQKLYKRIKTIANNEIQTINAQLTLKRSQNLGITKGIYRTSHDEAVRECHRELDGKEFELSKGAWSAKCQKWIIPGVTDINCRCTYSPIIDSGDITVPQTPPVAPKPKSIPIPAPKPEPQPIPKPVGLNLGQLVWKTVNTIAEVRQQVYDIAKGISIGEYSKSHLNQLEVTNHIGKTIVSMINSRPDLKRVFNNTKVFDTTVKSHPEMPDVTLGQCKTDYHRDTQTSNIIGNSSIDINGNEYDEDINDIAEPGKWNTCEGTESTIRHEFGHAIYNQVKHQHQLVAIWESIYNSKSRKEWQDTISEYASALSAELFAESFSLWSHPDYGTVKPNRKLPSEIENFIEHVVSKY